MSKNSKRSENGMVCPYCEHLHEQGDFEPHDYGDGVFECWNCEKEFSFSCFTSYSWTTTECSQEAKDE